MHKRELNCAKELCKINNIPHVIIPFDLTVFGGSPLTDTNIDIPKQADNKQASTVVPFRNTLFITLCAAYCKQHDLNTIYIGATYEDLASYEDCRPNFFESLQNTLRLGGTVHDLEICTPFIGAHKHQIIKLGYHTFGVPYGKTYTCYKGEEEPCLECDACIERIEAFVTNSIRDPLVTDDQKWHDLELGYYI